MSAPQMSAPVSRREFARLEGCDEKQVRRGIASGKLVADAQGNLDPAQVGSGWRKPRADTKDRPAAAGADTGADTTKDVRDAVAGVPVVASAEASRLKNAVAHKEDYAGRLKELEYRQKSGELVEIVIARQVLFEEFRAARDAWLNWPTRFAALIASDLGLEADRVAAVLTTYVHKQLAALGEPSGEFRQG
jgi:hypothetical protein